jgi:hypothetical protein
MDKEGSVVATSLNILSAATRFVVLALFWLDQANATTLSRQATFGPKLSLSVGVFAAVSRSLI